MTGRIQVAARVRPPTVSEAREETEAVVLHPGLKSNVTIVNEERHCQQTFQLDIGLGPEATQEEVYAFVVPMVEGVLKGESSTVLSFGVTGSGKTHTMQGTVDQPGLIPRTVEALMGHAWQMQQADSDREGRLEISMTYLEIYKDKVYDLLSPPGNRPALQLSTGRAGHAIAAAATEFPLMDLDQFYDAFDQASADRRTSSTLLNATSSRSHAILTLNVKVVDCGGAYDRVSSSAMICLVDLAGSERNKLTGNDKAGLAESSAINTSLTNLATVIDALRDRKAHVPFRNTKLTRLLQPALEGNARCLLLVCLAPGQKNCQQNLHALKTACRASEIETEFRDLSAPKTAVAPTGKESVDPGHKRKASRKAPLDVSFRQQGNTQAPGAARLNIRTAGHKRGFEVHQDGAAGPQPESSPKKRVIQVQDIERMSDDAIKRVCRL